MALLGNSKVNEVLYAKSLQIENNGSLGHGYCICDTPAATTEKVITIDNYSPVVGGLITVKFTYSVPGSATLNISNTGAKPIRFNGAAVKTALIRDGDTVSMVYDGVAYDILSVLPFDRLWGRDTRAVASPPSYYMDYSAILTSEFKSGTSINSPLGNSGYSHLLTLAPWGDSSGGYPAQIAVPSSADSTIAFRRGTSNTDWGAWKGLATQDWVEAKGYKTTDNNTWRPITVSGTKLTDTASLTITAGDNVTLTATAAGVVSIAAKDTTYGTVTKDAAGLVPKLTAGTTKATSAYRIFASVDGSTAPSWYQLPDNAFKNDNTVTKVGTSTSDAATGTVLLAGAGNINVTKADNVITIKNDFNISDYSKVGHTHAEYLPLDGSKAMTGRLVINKAGSGQSDSAAGHIALQKSGVEYAHIRLTASNSNLAIESKGGIILYGGKGDSGTEFSSANYVGFYAGKVNASGTVDLNGFRNLGLSGTITHGNATLTLPSSTGTLALTTHSHTLSGTKTTASVNGKTINVVKLSIS